MSGCLAWTLLLMAIVVVVVFEVDPGLAVCLVVPFAAAYSFVEAVNRKPER